MGASVEAEGVRFRVWAPTASRAEVELPNDGRLIMERERDGVWSAVARGMAPGARYRYRIDDQGAFPDPYSRFQPEGVHGPSEVVDPGAFTWHDQGWPGLSIQGLAIYQCHVGTATSEGTFDALIEQLPRLQALGVNAIEPLPVAEFPGARNWGYDGVDLFAPSHVYGGPAGLKRLIDAAHAHGLGVILDVVYNHFGPDGNYLSSYSPYYFTSRYSTPWGDAVDYDGPHSRWVRKLVIDNARYWLREFHVDGLRLDATHAIYDASERHILGELSQAARDAVDRPIVLIAETHENDVRYLQPVEAGGFGMDAVWADEFHHIVRRYLAGDHESYFARYAGSLDELARCIERGWLHGADASQQPPWQFVYVIQNHDQVGNRAMGDRLHHQVELGRYAAASALLLFLPMTPMLFMGQEFAASSPFQYFTDHNPELGKLVTEGRRKEFKAFSAFADADVREKIPDPQAESTFSRSRLNLDEAQQLPGTVIAQLYRQLLHLRRTDPVLRVQHRDGLAARALTRDVLAVQREHNGAERLLLVNFGDKGYLRTGFGDGWRVLLDTSGSSDPNRVPPTSATILGRERA